MSIVTECSRLMRDHLTVIAMALVTSVMTVYGNDMTRVVRNAIKAHNFFVRASVFFFLVAFGYGALALVAGSLIGQMLGALNNHWLAPTVVVLFLIVAVAAEEKRQI